MFFFKDGYEAQENIAAGRRHRLYLTMAFGYTNSDFISHFLIARLHIRTPESWTDFCRSENFRENQTDR